MSEFDLVAADLRTTGRTLRRAANRGTIRCRRLSPNRAQVPPEEIAYLWRRWPLLSALLGVLRTRHDVRLGVVFGSVARGDDHGESDLDLLVSFAGDDALAPSALALRLEEVFDGRVQVVPLVVAESSPMLLADALRDGRVLVNRDGEWERLRGREAQIERAAERRERELDAAAWQALEYFEQLA